VPPTPQKWLQLLSFEFPYPFLSFSPPFAPVPLSTDLKMHMPFLKSGRIYCSLEEQTRRFLVMFKSTNVNAMAWPLGRN
jgi:hypothetical protein